MESKKAKILVVDDEPAIRRVMSDFLSDEGFEIRTANDGKMALQEINDWRPDLCFLDIWMPGDLDGIEVLEKIRGLTAQPEVVMISGHGTIETAVKATKLGAWDFIEKPLSMDKINIIINNILNYQTEKEEKQLLLNKLRKSIALMGEASAIVQAKQLISRLAPTASWALIIGETGVGKELVAQNIHYMSPRASRPFVEVNCSAIPEDLLEGELFGIEKGALPGVEKTKKGKLELAVGGTLYIEEIGSMSLAVQSKLLRYLQEKKFTRLGGASLVEVDVRVICSNPKELDSELKTGKFREDFYHRLNVIPFQIPPLRQRKEDIPVLVSFFGDQFSRESGYTKKVFSEKALETMGEYEWPGNIRELKNFIERVYILTPGEYIDAHDIRFAGLAEKENGQVSLEEMSSFREARAKFEKEYLLKKIDENGGNISKTAEVIGLERSYLHRKIKAYGIEVN